MNIKNFVKSEVFRASITLIALTFLGNIFSYLFQFFSARMLGPKDYVLVAVLTSLVAIFGIPSSAIQTVISKNTTNLNVKKGGPAIKGLMKSSLKRMFLISFIIFLLYSLFSIVLSDWLNINYIYLFLIGFFIFGSFSYPVMLGIAQGMKRFSDFGLNFLLNCIIKFVVGIGLIYLGLKIYGAIAGFLAGIFLAFLFFFYSFRDIIKSKTKKFSIKIFSEDNLYPLLTMIIFVLLFNFDVVFAKAFFSDELAGKYSVVSLIGKMILFVISSIGTVLLPISSEKHLGGKNTNDVLKKTSSLALFICIVAMIGFILFPQFIISLLFGNQYSSISNILIYVGLAFCFLSFLNIYLLQAIATNKINRKTVILLFLCLSLEVTLFVNFSKDIRLYSIGFMISAMISMIGGYIINKYG